MAEQAAAADELQSCALVHNNMNDIRYLNVDLIIKSKEDLSPIINSFGKKAFVLHHGKKGKYYYAYLETAKCYDKPSKSIKCFCSLIDAFRPNEKIIWDNAISKIFDVGFDSGEKPSNYTTDIEQEILEGITKCGATLRVTIYPMIKEKKKVQSGYMGYTLFQVHR